VECGRNIPELVFIFIFYFFVARQIIPYLGLDEAISGGAGDRHVRGLVQRRCHLFRHLFLALQAVRQAGKTGTSTGAPSCLIRNRNELRR